MTYAVPDGYDHSVISAVKAGDKEAQDFFNKWKEEVIATVPPERLLVFEAKQGWEPLCKFLDVPVPTDGPYPRVNDTAAFRAHINFLKVLSYAIVFGLPVAAGTFAAWMVGML